MKITVQDKTNNRTEVQVSAKTDGYYDYCSHAHQNIEVEAMSAGMDDEYYVNLAVCQKCGAGWDEDGEQRLEADCE